MSKVLCKVKTFFRIRRYKPFDNFWVYNPYCEKCNLMYSDSQLPRKNFKMCDLCGNPLSFKKVLEIPCPKCLCGAPLRIVKIEEKYKWECSDHGIFTDNELLKIYKNKHKEEV